MLAATAAACCVYLDLFWQPGVLKHWKIGSVLNQTGQNTKRLFIIKLPFKMLNILSGGKCQRHFMIQYIKFILNIHYFHSNATWKPFKLCCSSTLHRRSSGEMFLSAAAMIVNIKPPPPFGNKRGFFMNYVRSCLNICTSVFISMPPIVLSICLSTCYK